MTQSVKIILKDLNRNYFDKHIQEVRWSRENRLLTIIMDSKEEFSFNGDDGKLIYKQLMHE